MPDIILNLSLFIYLMRSTLTIPTPEEGLLFRVWCFTSKLDRATCTFYELHLNSLTFGFF